MNFKKVFTSMFLCFAVLAFATPSFAATNFRINRNGADSRNRINFTSKTKFVKEQVNEVSNINQIAVTSNTGDNEAEDNTGGSTHVSSGNVTTNVTVTNAGATNVADGSDCGCVGDQDTNARISRNGADSVNTIDITKSFVSKTTQYNAFVNLNSVAVNSNTGDNEAEENTGDGDVHVDSGNVNTTVIVTNAGAHNEL